MIDWLVRRFFGARKADIEAALADVQARFEKVAEAMKADRAQAEKRRPGPARLVVEGLMSERAIEEALAGTETHPVMRAVSAVIQTKIAELSDGATERPRVTLQRGQEMIAGYSEEERLHDAGGCANLAELLAKLQMLSKPRADEAAPGG